MVIWEEIKAVIPTGTIGMYRARVPGGWLILVEYSGGSVAFYPDPDHMLTGSSLP